MLSHEMHMKAIASDRYSARLAEAEVYRLTKKSQRPNQVADAIGKAAMVVRHALSVLSAARSPAINDRHVMS